MHGARCRSAVVGLVLLGSAGSMLLGSPRSVLQGATRVSAGSPYHQIAVLTPPQIPGQFGLVSDIVFNDASAHRLYLSDDANAQVDVWSTLTNRFVGAISGGFTGETGFPAGFDQLGPAGLVVDDMGQVWAGNGDGTVKVGSTRTLKEIDSIPTGGTLRADELAYDPIDRVILVTNPSDAHPFVTLIGAVSHKVLRHVSLGAKVPVDSIEQPQWDPLSGDFLVSVRQVFPGDTKGEIAVVDPRTRALEGGLPLSVDCNPAGMTLGPNGDALLGCDSAPAVIVDRRTGRVDKVFPGQCCADEVWFNRGDGRYYVSEFLSPDGTGSAQVLEVINAWTMSIVTDVPISDPAYHAVAAGGEGDDSRAYVPLSDGVHVFGHDNH